MTMRVELENDQSGEVFFFSPKQLLDIGNGKISVDSSSGNITFPTNICHLTETKTKLIEVFPIIAQNYKNRVWLSERVILAAKKLMSKK